MPNFEKALETDVIELRNKEIDSYLNKLTNFLSTAELDETYPNKRLRETWQYRR